MGLLRANAAFVRFITSSLRTSASAASRCAGWTAQDVVAHVAAGSEELAALTALALVGRSRPTRDFESREVPYRELTKIRLHVELVRHGVRLTWLLMRLQTAKKSIDFTGTTMSAAELFRHAESELVLHRFDLVGLDRLARRRLADPALVAHAHAVVGRMDAGVLPAPSASPYPLLAVWGR